MQLVKVSPGGLVNRPREGENRLRPLDLCHRPAPRHGDIGARPHLEPPPHLRPASTHRGRSSLGGPMVYVGEPDSLDGDGVVAELTALLGSVSTPERAEHEKRYLKSELDHIGARVPDVRRITRRALRGRVANDRAATLESAQAHWYRPVHDLPLAAALSLPQRLAPLVREALPI